MRPFTFIGPYIIFFRHAPLVRDIQRTVAKHFRLPVSEMVSDRRVREIARPRQIAMYLCRKHTPRSMPAIAKLFGDRDHTTILHGIRQIEKLIVLDAAVASDVKKLSQIIGGPHEGF